MILLDGVVARAPTSSPDRTIWPDKDTLQGLDSRYCRKRFEQSKYYYGEAAYGIVLMPEHITETEMQRIREFAETPVYLREPEQLMPDSGEE